MPFLSDLELQLERELELELARARALSLSLSYLGVHCGRVGGLGYRTLRLGSDRSACLVTRCASAL